MTATHDRPLAADGYTSYRCRTPYGWTMIGAHDHADALRQAARSSDGPRAEDLQVWDGEKYVDAYPATVQ